MALPTAKLFTPYTPIARSRPNLDLSNEGPITPSTPTPASAPTQPPTINSAPGATNDDDTIIVSSPTTFAPGTSLLGRTSYAQNAAPPPPTPAPRVPSIFDNLAAPVPVIVFTLPAQSADQGQSENEGEMEWQYEDEFEYFPYPPWYSKHMEWLYDKVYSGRTTVV